MGIIKPSYVVNRATPGTYRILKDNKAVFVRKQGRFWYMNGNYYRTLRDAIIGML